MEPVREKPPPYTPPGTTTIITSPTIVPGPTIFVSQVALVGASPTVMICPSCNAQILTRVEKTPSVRTHVIAALLCLFIFWPCTCIPYCIDSCNNAEHYCPNCSAYIGSYRF